MRAAYESSARFKPWPMGRRAAKTRTALSCAMCGHGPIVPVTGQHLYRGVFEGAQIAWVSPDYKQADAVWRKEIRPRLAGKPGVTISKTDRIVTVECNNGETGLLEIRSNENVDAIRGNHYHGIVCDEAGYFDLEYAWHDVIEPALVDKAGWAIMASTTNAGKDGNEEARIPSYFNLMVAQLTQNPIYDDLGIEMPELDPNIWQVFHRRTRDNPVLPKAEVERIYAQHTPDSPTLQQEYDALLIRAHGGRAFPEFDDVHVVPTKRYANPDYNYYGCLDWGYVQGAYYLISVDPDGRCELIWEYYDDFKRKHAAEAAEEIFTLSRHLPLPKAIYFDNQMAADTGVKGGMRLIDEWNAGLAKMVRNPQYTPIMIPSAKEGQGRKTYRQTKKNIMHKYLQWEDIRDPRSNELQPWAAPKLRVQAHCKGFIREMMSLSVADHDVEDVDTTQPDHCLIGSTLVLVDRACIPIDSVQVGDRVLTRQGWKRVLSRRMTNPSAAVFTASFSNGKNLTGTANHPVYVIGRGFIRYDALSLGDCLLPTWSVSLWAKWSEWKSRLKQYRYGVAKSITGAGSTFNGMVSGFIGACSRIPVGLSPPAGISTTSTGIGPTTDLKTSRPTKATSTSGITASSPSMNASVPREAGMLASTPLLGTPNLPKNNVVPPRVKATNYTLGLSVHTPAQAAERFVSRCFRWAATLPIVKNATCVLTRLVSAGNAPVYNLMVEDAPEFVAEGVLVHNSYDAVCFFLVANALGPEVREPPTNYDIFTMESLKERHQPSYNEDWDGEGYDEPGRFHLSTGHELEEIG